MVNVFSFCIYGPEQPKYHDGLIENIRIIADYFPEWRVFVYIGSDTTPRFIRKLESKHNVVLRFTNIRGHKNSVNRFFAIDEPNVDMMMVRDADSRVHWKDRWAINNFLKSDKGIHLIRDHTHHNALILAGLWGLRKGALSRPIGEMYNEWTPVFAGYGNKDDPEFFGIDQNFLVSVIYPMMSDKILVHYSFNYIFSGEEGEEFPFTWSNSLYCGRVENPIGIQIIPGLPYINKNW